MTALPRPLVRLHWHHPEWVAAAGVAAGWAVLVAPLAGEPVLLVRGGHVAGPGAVGHAAAMAAAMMLPLVLDHVRDAATSSPWRSRYRAALTHVAGYLVLWTAAGAAMTLLLHGVRPVVGTLPLVAALGGLAVLVTASDAHRRRLRRCGATRPLALEGWRADRDHLEAGCRLGVRCLATTWPVMLVAMAQGGVLVLAAGTVVMLVERRGLVPGRDVTRLTVGLVLLAVALAAAPAPLAGLPAGLPVGPHGGH